MQINVNVKIENMDKYIVGIEHILQLQFIETGRYMVTSYLAFESRFAACGTAIPRYAAISK